VPGVVTSTSGHGAGHAAAGLHKPPSSPDATVNHCFQGRHDGIVVCKIVLGAQGHRNVRRDPRTVIAGKGVLPEPIRDAHPKARPRQDGDGLPADGVGPRAGRLTDDHRGLSQVSRALFARLKELANLATNVRSSFSVIPLTLSPHSQIWLTDEAGTGGRGGRADRVGRQPSLRGRTELRSTTLQPLRSCLIRSRFPESSISVASRRSRVSSRFALVTQRAVCLR